MNDLTTAPLLDPLPARSAATHRPRLWRSVVAFLVSVSLLLAMTGVAVFAQTSRSATGGPAYVPDTAVGYAELRLDMPGDQHDQLSAFMAHFPGFADAAAFDTKFNQLLDQALSSATSGAATWTGNVQTWFNGQASIGLLALPTTAGAQPSIVVGLGLRDRAALETQLTSLMGTTPVSTEDYAGTTIATAGDVSYAITDPYLLVSPTIADVKVSLDVLAGTVPSLAEDADFQAARATQPADVVGAFYLTTAAFKPLIEQQLAQQAGAEMLLAQLANLPVWISGYAQVGGDHVALGGSTQLVAGSMVPAVRETDLAAQFPADTLLFLETRDLGNTVDALLAQLKTQLAADPKSTQTITGVEQGLGATLDKLFEFVQDGAVGVSFDGQHLSAGIVATLTDEAVAGRRIDVIIGLLRLMGSSLPVTISTADVNGAIVTTITLQPSADLPPNLPFDPSVSVAVTDGHLYLGLDDFAATAIAQDPQTSLATDPRYAAGVTAAGSPNAGVVWVDVAAAAPLVAGILLSNPPTDPGYVTNVKPWVDALDYFVATATADGDIVSLKALLFVK